MKSAGYDTRENDPFESRVISLKGREASPYVNRLKIMWQQMRGVIYRAVP